MKPVARLSGFAGGCCLILVLGTAKAAPYVLAGASQLEGRRPAQPQPVAGTDSRESVTLSGLPVDLVENRGQWNMSARFVATRGAVWTALEPDGFTLHSVDSHAAPVRLVFENTPGRATLEGEEQRSGRYNYFLGNDPSRWRSDVPAYGAVRYRNLYEGVDAIVRERQGRLEYDLVLLPAADLDRVAIRVEGAFSFRIEDGGSLVVETADGDLRQTPPRTWEELADGTRRAIDSRFRRIDATHFGFAADRHDPALRLVVDPGLEWSTFLGGGNREEIHGLALTRDGSGDVVVAGHPWSADFPVTAGAFGANPVVPFVARMNASGTALVYATLFGGTGGNVAYAFDVALDASSAPVVVGTTNTLDFPTTAGAYDTTFNAPGNSLNREWDAFVTRFNSTGNQMVFSTFLGAAPIPDATRPGGERGGAEEAHKVVVDAFDSVVVAGWTTSENFPTTVGAYDRTLAVLSVAVDLGTIESRMDAFIARLNPTGTQLTYSTYLGGQSDDRVQDMVIDARGVLTLVGVEAPLETFDAQNNRTDHGTPFPTTADAVSRTHLGASDAFLARLSLDGAGAADLKYSTIFGGFYIDEATGIALDPNNPELVTVCGDNRSWDFPTTPGAWSRAPIFLSDGTPYYSGFVTRFRFPATGGGSLVWSTLIEGTIGAQLAQSVAVDASGDVIVVGTDEGGLSTTERSYKRVPSTGIFVSRFSGDGRNLLYSTFLHGASGVFGDLLLKKHIVSTGPHAVIVAGATLFPDFPTTAGAFDRLFGNDGTSDNFHRYDGFVSKLTLDPNPTTDTTAAAPTLVSPPNGATFPLGSTLTLDWTDVADPSGVQLYEVAVNMNAEFLPGYGFVFQPGAGFYTSSQWSGPTSQEGVFYWRVRTLDGVNNFSPWSEVRKFTLGAPVWTNFAAAAIIPNSVVGAGTVQGKVHIMNVAPAGGQVYTLTSSKPSVASVPASVTVPAGASSATFAVTTHSVAVSTPVMITVWSEGNGDHPILWVDPGSPAPPGVATLASLTVSPTSVAGGAPSQGTVTLSGPAPSGGAVVALSSSGSAASVPATLTVSGGAASATFGITTTTVSSSTPVTITATYAGVNQSATLTVTPPAPPPTPSAPSLVSPANGATLPLPVTLDWTDVNLAASYRIQIDDSSTFSAPRVVDQTVTVSQFTVGTLASRQHWWRVRGVNSAGTAGVWSAVRSFTPQSAPSPPALSAISLNPSTVVGGNSSQGTATLTSAAPAGGAVVTLSSNNTGAATVPANVTIAAGSTSATFAITTFAVSASTPVTISGSYGGATRTTTLTATPPAPPPGSTATLTVTATGRSGERVTSSPAGINVAVGSTGSAPFTTGTSITLTISNGRDAIWSGACSSGGSKAKTCRFTPTTNATVSANVQ
jgi:hypothetical protein